MQHEYFDTIFAGVRYVAIFRNFSPDYAVELAHTAWDLGIDIVEVPIQTPETLPTLRAVISAAKAKGKIVGTGTVTTLEQLEISQNEGADFTVAPGFDPEIAAESVRRGIPHLPGTATPTEIQAAVKAGATWIKAFPASALGPQWFTAIKGPFPELKIVATGGLDAHNAQDFLAAGANVISVGSALSDPAQLTLLGEQLNN